MITEKELLKAIEELKDAPVSFQTCQKLATFCTVYDYFYGEKPEKREAGEPTLNTRGETEFLRAVDGQKASKVLAVMAELMDALEVTQPRMYEGVLRRLGKED